MSRFPKTDAILEEYFKAGSNNSEVLIEGLQKLESEAYSWEACCRVQSTAKLLCGHPNDYAYDKNGDGKFSNIGCVGCDNIRLKKELEEAKKSQDVIEIKDKIAEWYNSLPTDPHWDCLREDMKQVLGDQYVVATWTPQQIWLGGEGGDY